MDAHTVIAADVGGTKTLLQQAEFVPRAARARRVLHEALYPSADYPDILPLLEDFLHKAPAPADAVCLAVAGPIRGAFPAQSAQLTNLPWRLDAQTLGARLGVPVRLLNDFAAVGYGLDALQPEDLATLHAGQADPAAPRLALGAGTGLGVALVAPCAEDARVLPSEGGHMDFAGGSALQDGLLGFLRAEFGHVSWERVVSGPGIVNIYRYLLARHGADDVEGLLAAADPPAAIAASSAATAQETMAQFSELYGAIAGNLALATLPRGGIYLAGGIAAKNLPRLRQGGFVHGYLHKGRLRDVLESIPIHVITNPQVGLLGALRVANQTLS